MGQKNAKSLEPKNKQPGSASRKGGTDGRTRRKHSPGNVDDDDRNSSGGGGGSGGGGKKYTKEEISEMERKFNEQMKKEAINTEKRKMSKYGRRFSIALKQPPFREQPPTPQYQPPQTSPSSSSHAASGAAMSSIGGGNAEEDEMATTALNGTPQKHEKSKKSKKSERKKANRASMPPSTAALLELRFGEEARKELENEQKMHKHSGSSGGSGNHRKRHSGIHQRKSESPAQLMNSPSTISSLSPMDNNTQVAHQSSSSISPSTSSSSSTNNNNNSNNNININININNSSSNINISNDNISNNNNNNSNNNTNSNNSNGSNSSEKWSWGRRMSHSFIKKSGEKADKTPEKQEKQEKPNKKRLQLHRSSILITTSDFSNYNSAVSGGGNGSLASSSLTNSPSVGLQSSLSASTSSSSHSQVSQPNTSQAQQPQASNTSTSGSETPSKRRWLRFGRRNSRVVSTEFSRDYLQKTLDSYDQQQQQQPSTSSPGSSLANSPASGPAPQPQSLRLRSKGSGDIGAGVSPPSSYLLGLFGYKSKGNGDVPLPPPPQSSLSHNEYKPESPCLSPRMKKADSPTLKPSATATSSSSSLSSSQQIELNRPTRKRSQSTAMSKPHRKTYNAPQEDIINNNNNHHQQQQSLSHQERNVMSLPHKTYLTPTPPSQYHQSHHHRHDSGSGSGSNGSGGGSSNDSDTPGSRQRSKTETQFKHLSHSQRHQKHASPPGQESSPRASSPLPPQKEQSPIQQPQQPQPQYQQSPQMQVPQQPPPPYHIIQKHQQTQRTEVPSMLAHQQTPLIESNDDSVLDLQPLDKDDDDLPGVSPLLTAPRLQQPLPQKATQDQQQQQQNASYHQHTPSTSSASSSATVLTVPAVPSPITILSTTQSTALSPSTTTLAMPSLPSPPSPHKVTPETSRTSAQTLRLDAPPISLLAKSKSKSKPKPMEISPTTTLTLGHERGKTPPSPSSPLSPSSASSAASTSSAYPGQVPIQQPPALVLPRFRVPKVPQSPSRAGSATSSISPSPVTQSPPSSGGLSKLPYYKHKSNLSKMSIASTRSSSTSTVVSEYENNVAFSESCSTASSCVGSTVASSSSSSTSSSSAAAAASGSSSSSSSSSSTISAIGADYSVASRSGYGGGESDTMSFESTSTTSSFVPAQIVKKEQEKRGKRSHRCANNGTYRATLFSDTQPYKVSKSLNPQSNNLTLVQVRYEKEGDSAASSLWTFAIDPACTGYDLCLSVLQTDPATQTLAMMRARKGVDIRALVGLGVRLYKVDESDNAQLLSAHHNHSNQPGSKAKPSKIKVKKDPRNVDDVYEPKVEVKKSIADDDDDDDNDDDSDSDDDDDDDDGDEFDPDAPNVTQITPGDRIATHISAWKSGRDGYFVVYDTSKVFPAQSAVKGEDIPICSTATATTSTSTSTSTTKKASPAILVDMRSGSSGEQSSEAWIPEEDIFWVSRISSGTFSRVYKGIYKGKYVAIKILKGGLCARNIAEFRKEFHVLKSVQHPNLLECYGASFEHNKLSYVIEYCQRGTLLHVMTDPSLKIGWDHAADFFAQALRGLCFLHEHDPPIVHRDLKSQNLLVTRSYEIKIGDFGLSRFNTASNNPTLSNMCGTMTHCAPEIFSGDLFTPKADVYSMGMILWELCTRVATGSYAPPYSEYPNIVLDIQIIAQAATKNLRPTVPESVPKKFADLIEKCWDKDPGVRPDSAQLLRLVDGLPQRRMGLLSRPNRKFSSLGSNKKRPSKGQIVDENGANVSGSSTRSSSSQNSHNSYCPPVTPPPPPLPPPVNVGGGGGSSGNTPGCMSTGTVASDTSYSTSSSFPMSTPSPHV